MLAGSPVGPGAFSSLKQMMGLPEAPIGPLPEKQLPTAPHKVMAAAHKGGCCSLVFERPGHFVATCGMDKTAVCWDLNQFLPVNTYQVGVVYIAK